MRERTAPATPLDPAGHSAPAVGFEVPLEMLAACHGRVQAQCATLRRLAAHLASQGADRQAQDAPAAVMRYFDTSAVHHHADEELDLFPALIESMAGSDAVCVRELTASLVAEHRELEQRWRTLHRRLEQVTRAEAATLPGDEVRAFIDLYERHIAREEAELLPMAGRLLSDAELDRIGLAMRARAGAFIDPSRSRHVTTSSALVARCHLPVRRPWRGQAIPARRHLRRAGQPAGGRDHALRQ